MSHHITALEERIARLEAIAAIEQLKHRYWRCLDGQQWDELRTCFAPDVTCAYEDGHYSYRGVDEVMAFISESIPPLRERRAGMHLGLHPEIEVIDATHARGRWLLHVMSWDRGAPVFRTEVGYYRDEYVELDGEWKIQHTGYDSVYFTRLEGEQLHVVPGAEIDSRAANVRSREQSRTAGN